MDILFRAGRATATEVQTALGEPVSNSAVRGMLRHLASKGYVAHEQDGPRYVYVPVVARDSAKRSALAHLVRTFFDGSTEDAVAALLDGESTRLSNAELDRLSGVIARAKQKRS